MPCAAPTSAAVASQLSHDHRPHSAAPPSIRRLTSSAIAASRRGDAAPPTRAQPVTAATTIESSAHFSSSRPGSALSNIHSIISGSTDSTFLAGLRMVGLWKNTQLWITRRHPLPDGSLLGGKQRVGRQDQGMPHPPPL